MSSSLPLNRRERWAQWWELRSRAERRALTLAGAVVALALAWALLWQPLAGDTERLARLVASDRSALLEARREADDIAGLARRPPAPASAEPRAALDPVLAQRGLKGTASSIERIDNDRVRLTFETIAFDALTAFLDALQREARLRAVEVVATARVEPGMVRADLTLSR